MLDLILEIGQTLRNNKLRTILTGISVAWGVFMLILLLGASRGVRNSFFDNMSGMSSNTISIWGGRTSKPYQGYQVGRYVGLKSSDIDAIKDDNRSTVSEAVAYASDGSATISSALDVLTDGFEAVFPEARERRRIEMKHGRFINRRDISDCRRSIILSENNARLLFGSDEKAVGNTVQCLGLAWTVVGVYTNPWRTQSIIPYTTYKAVTGSNDETYQLEVFVKGLETEEDGERAESGIRSTLARQHHFSPDDGNAVWINNRFTNYLKALDALSYLDLAVWVIGIFTLLTGIVGISNIMFVSVRERTHEIGIRRAIGAKPRAILTQVLAESVAVTALFGYIGIVMGMVSLEILSQLVGDGDGFKNPTVDISIAVEVTAALIAAGTLAGLFPALKAIKVKPVEALRDE